MKIYISFLAFALISIHTIAQTNTFPSSGNVGIGTSNPQAKLDVNGVIQTYNKDNNGAYWDNMQMWSDGENSYIQSNGDEKGLHIKSNIANKILLESNVGIGTDKTSDPNYRLFVETGIRTRKVRVDQQIWADFVFNDNYKLQPLTEVEQYIKIHKHLPDMPSAKEVAKNGIDVGDNQALLLQKIEELTLYVIEMKKENEQLNQKVNKLQSKIIQISNKN